MSKKEIVKAMLDAVLEAEELTGGHLFFDYSPHVEAVGVFTYTTKTYDTDCRGSDLVYLMNTGTELTEEALDALRWRLLPENLRKVWTKA